MSLFARNQHQISKYLVSAQGTRVYIHVGPLLQIVKDYTLTPIGNNL